MPEIERSKPNSFTSLKRVGASLANQHDRIPQSSNALLKRIATRTMNKKQSRVSCEVNAISENTAERGTIKSQLKIQILPPDGEYDGVPKAHTGTADHVLNMPGNLRLPNTGMVLVESSRLI
mgnify:CR=1 FL=1